ncbi:MAG TPA: serine hydrolase domain-containing protein [Cytophagaceae bacterium]|jgi:CubicO group peptidase (beta-lactamase class C family)
MKKIIQLIVYIAIVCNCDQAKAQGRIQRGKAHVFQRTTDSLVSSQMTKQHIPGLSLAIIKDGKVLIAKGYGLANLEHNIPATEETIYKIGSVSKQMIATATMVFIQEGRLKLTDSIPKFFKGSPEAWNKITIRHLLNHTSGLPRESPLSDNMKVQADSVLIRAAYDSKLLFEPGSAWQYCNLGYFMLADIIRQLSGDSFASFMEKQIFNKHNLSNTRTTTSSAVIKNRADGYVYKNDGSFYNAQDYLALRPSGAFISSINDLIKWEMLIQNNSLLSQENWQKMWQDKVKTPNADKPPFAHYGYGWDVIEYKKALVQNHGGSLPGFSSKYFRFVDHKTAIIVLTNANGANLENIVYALADQLFPVTR